MKHLKTKEIPATVKTVTDFITCDLCNEKIEESNYRVDEVLIEHTVGTRYLEGGSGEEMKIDMCGKCFDTKFISWLNSQGFDPKLKEWSF